MRRIILSLLTSLIAFVIGCLFVLGLEKLGGPADGTNVPTEPQAEGNVIPAEPNIYTEESHTDRLGDQVNGKSSVAQSSIVKFPINGRVIVQAREEPGKYPEMVFISERTGRVLLRSTIHDRDKYRWLFWDPRDDGSHPALRI